MRFSRSCSNFVFFKLFQYGDIYIFCIINKQISKTNSRPDFQVLHLQKEKDNTKPWNSKSRLCFKNFSRQEEINFHFYIKQFFKSLKLVKKKECSLLSKAMLKNATLKLAKLFSSSQKE